MQLGPLTITSTRKWRAYHRVAACAYAVHQIIWFADLGTTTARQELRDADAALSDAISRVDPLP